MVGGGGKGGGFGRGEEEGIYRKCNAHLKSSNEISELAKTCPALNKQRLRAFPADATLTSASLLIASNRLFSLHLPCLVLRTILSAMWSFTKGTLWEQVKAMKPQEIARTWAEYLSAMMRHLTAAQTGDPEVAKMAERRIADLIQEVLTLPCSCTVKPPTAVPKATSSAFP